MPFESDPVILSLLSAKIYRTALVSTAPEILLPRIYFSAPDYLGKCICMKAFQVPYITLPTTWLKAKWGGEGERQKTELRIAKHSRLLKGNWVTFYWQTALHKMR